MHERVINEVSSRCGIEREKVEDIFSILLEALNCRFCNLYSNEVSFYFEFGIENDEKDTARIEQEIWAAVNRLNSWGTICDVSYKQYSPTYFTISFWPKEPN